MENKLYVEYRVIRKEIRYPDGNVDIFVGIYPIFSMNNLFSMGGILVGISNEPLAVISEEDDMAFSEIITIMDGAMLLPVLDYNVIFSLVQSNLKEIGNNINKPQKLDKQKSELSSMPPEDISKGFEDYEKEIDDD